MSALERAIHQVPALTRRAIWLLGLLFFVVVAAWSTSILLDVALAARRSAGTIPAALVVAATLGIMAIGFLGRGLLRSHPLATGLAVLAVSRLLVVLAVPTPLISDFLNYHQIALQVAGGAAAWQAVPIGWPLVLGAAYAVLGANPVTGELLNVVLASISGYLVYDIGLRAFDRRAAVLGLWLFAVAPAQVLYVVVLGSEALYGTLILGAVWAVVRLGWGRVLTGVVAGALLGASQYVRATSPALIPAFVLAALLGPSRPRGAGRVAIVLVASFLLVLAPVALHNIETQGVPSISTSTFGGWTLLVGTDPAGNGSYSPRLRAQLERPDSPLGSIDFDRRAMALAIATIREDPGGVAALIIRKIPKMWAIEDYGVKWVFHPNTPAYDMAPSRTRRLLTLTSQVAYVCLAILAAITLALRRSLGQGLLLMILIFLAIAAVHSVVEVQPRYHAYLVPLLCVVAGACRIPRTAAVPDDTGTSAVDGTPPVTSAAASTGATDTAS